MQYKLLLLFPASVRQSFVCTVLLITSLERTKFFEYILPVIPIINSTNSGEKLLERVNKDRESGLNIELSDEYITLISPYINAASKKEGSINV